ncbi:MAG: ATP synthase F0 subunit B, partial [Candidatus Omnitrophica bacterium]|nr:ATP synthase F0 subunit B [Candidatus Omnitrophota bacterium]
MFIVSIVLLMVFIFGGMFFFFYQLMTRNVTRATSHLQRMVKDNSDKQEDIQKKQDEAKKNYDETIKKAQKEAEDLKERAQKAVEAERDKIISQAHIQSEELLDRANKTCAAMQTDLDKNINDRALERCGELICQVLPEEVCRVLHGVWVEALITTGLSSLERLRVLDEVTYADIQTTFPLTEEQRQRLQSRLLEEL